MFAVPEDAVAVTMISQRVSVGGGFDWGLNWSSTVSRDIYM